MELVAPLPSGMHQTGLLEHLKMLRNRLPAQRKLVLHRQPRAQLEERLAIPFGQFVDDQSAYRCRQRMEDVGPVFLIHTNQE